MSIPIRSLMCVAVAGGLLLAGCHSSDDSSFSADDLGTSQAASPTTSSATTGDSSGQTIPAGLWTRHLTPDQAAANEKRLGLTQATVDTAVGTFATDLALSYKVGDGVWAQYQALDDGESTVGDSGTFTYDDEGNWSTVSNSTGCPGCVSVYRWSLDGDQLTLNFVPGYDADPVAMFVTEGTYQHTS